MSATGEEEASAGVAWRNRFSSSTPVLDIIHAISYLFAATLAGPPFAEGWPCYERWMRWSWKGEVDKVIAGMALRQAEPERCRRGDGAASACGR